MLILFLGVFLFGLTHPLGRIFLDNHLSVQAFCLMFLFLRVLLQVPVVWITDTFRIDSARQFRQLAVLGAVGALLHFSEFKSLGLGISVPAVSFLVFMHPVWTQLIRIVIYRDVFTLGKFLRVSAAVLAIGLILSPEWSGGLSPSRLIVPLIASVAFSLWVILSERTQRSGIPMVRMSFYYDLFSLLLLAAIGTGEGTIIADLQSLSSIPQALFFLLFAYSLFVGLVANYLFFIGIRSQGSMAGSYALLLEPVFSTLLSLQLFGGTLNVSFLIGAVLILLVNVPAPFYESLSRNLIWRKQT